MSQVEQLSDLKVMVTGASGFLGSHLCSRLVEVGAEVHGISRVARSTGLDDVQWWQGNLEDLSTVRHLVNAIKPDIVFHLSGHVTAAPHLEHVLPTFYSLLLSTVHLLMLASERGCRRMVVTGSLTEPVLGRTDDPPGSPYAAAKWASSTYARMFKALYQTPVVIVRPFMTFGPRQEERKIIPHVILSLLRGDVPKLSSGQWQADWIYVQDVIDGFLAAAERSGVEGCTIDLGSGTLVSVQEIVRQITELVGSRIEPLFGALADRPLEHTRVADIGHSYSKLGWRPNTSLADGLRETVDWYSKRVNSSPVSM